MGAIITQLSPAQKHWFALGATPHGQGWAYAVVSWALIEPPLRGRDTNAAGLVVDKEGQLKIAELINGFKSYRYMELTHGGHIRIDQPAVDTAKLLADREKL